MKKKSKFDAKQYIDNNYVENEEAIISVYIEETEDFYNEFDDDELTLSDDLIHFINNRVDNISIKYDLVLEFNAPKMKTTEQNKIITIIRSHYGLVLSSRQSILDQNKIKALFLFVLGLFLLLLSNSFDNLSSLIQEVISIAGWVAIWESISVIFMDNIKIKMMKKKVERLFNARIIFKERNSLPQ